MHLPLPFMNICFTVLSGWAASLFRLGPHTVISLVFWDQTRELYIRWHASQEANST